MRRDTETEPVIAAPGKGKYWLALGRLLIVQLSTSCLFMAFDGRTGTVK